MGGVGDYLSKAGAATKKRNDASGEGVFAHLDPRNALNPIFGLFDAAQPDKGPDAAGPGGSLGLGDPAIQAAKDAERRRLRGQAGRQSTFLAGALGDTKMPKLAAPTLLGGG